MNVVRILFACHLAALFFGVGGLLIAFPHPELWAQSPIGAQVYAFGMHRAGSVHILFGAATMFAFGLVALGWRKTLVFAFVATLLPLGSERLCTGTGWPFGAYSYTEGLGYKVLGRVPVTVPLSWFYMGFASYLLARVLLRDRHGRSGALLTLLLGACLLTAWDLVLDPAMASPQLPVQFWVWHQVGPYFGMPIRNLAEWSGTGLAFIAVSRWFWREDADVGRLPVWLPFAVYAANVVFAMALSLGVGIWLPSLAAVAVGVVPAALALRPGQLPALPFATPSGIETSTP